MGEGELQTLYKLFNFLNSNTYQVYFAMRND